MEAGVEAGAGSDAHPARRFSWLWAVAFAAVGVFLLVDSFSGRHLEAPKGQGFWGVVYIWTGAVCALWSWRSGTDSRLSPGSMVLLSLVGYVPGAALMWYAIWAFDQTRSGTCRTQTGATAHCVTGPGALIPWAVLLLGAAITFTILSLRRVRRRAAASDPAPAPG